MSSSHHPRSGSVSASAPATPAPTPSPQPPTTEEVPSQPLSQRGQQTKGSRTAYLAEEQPGLEVYRPPAPSSDTRTGRSRTRRPAPSYRSQDAAADPSKYTFYRDPTPTPPEYSEREKDGEYVAVPLPRRPGRSSTIALETALTIPPPDPRRLSSRQETVCGLGRRAFYCAAAALILLVVAIALGVGIGVGVGKKSHRVSEQPTPSPISSLPATTTTSPTATAATSSSSSSSSAGITSASPIPTASTDCPFINNTIYQVPGSPKSFLRLCGIDYSSASEAVELTHKPTFSFADCMGNCAGTYGCTGCSWGIMAGDSGADHQCWMKGSLKTGHQAAADWCFAILQQ